MKKVLLVLSVAAMFAFSSCNKCKTCSNQGVTMDELCAGDYPGGKSAYNNAIEALEDSGWDCE